MKRCSKCNLQHEDSQIYCSNCGNLLELVPVSSTQISTKKSTGVLVLLVLSIVLNIFLGISVYECYEDKEYYYEKYEYYYDENSQLLLSNKFYDDYARVVPDDGLGIYHRYGCEKLDMDYEFYIYNLYLAKVKASPCQNCCADD